MIYKNITKTYNNKKILDNITLNIEENTIVSIIGESGCGKTTLLKILSGILTDDMGRKNQFDCKVGYVPQGLGLLPWRTVKRNIEIPYELYGVDIDKEKVRNVLNLLRLSGFGNYKISELSGGMKQRVAIGRALVTDPDILFLDEPFRSLDEITREKLVDELYTTWKRLKKTVVIVTHSIFEAMHISDKIIVMSSPPSKIIFEGMPENEDSIRNVLLINRK